ncbi:lipid A biosynthesis lauroyl acyltransferase [Magnetovirga frankeli]|nr:lipid A biosynthesis lauroyl acyltransferase [gamma proteobacterium SS-5]
MVPMKADTHPLAPRNWPLWLGLGLLRLAVLLPYPLIMALGGLLGRLLYRLSPRRVGIARINIDLCLPAWGEAERAALLKAHFISTGQGLMELAMAWWMNPRRLMALVELPQAPTEQGLIAQAFAPGRGVIFLSAHFSSLDLSAYVLAQMAQGQVIRPMYRPHENPVIEGFFQRCRGRRYGQPLPREDVKGMLRALKANQGVWFAPDQNFGHKSKVFAPFFGQEAACNPATSRFARLSDAVVLPYVLLRKPDNQGYRVCLGPVLEDFPSDDSVADARRINARIEAWVRQAPEQYIWMHRRFKTRPGTEPSPYV